jgi:hypothetical protein
MGSMQRAGRQWAGAPRVATLRASRMPRGAGRRTKPGAAPKPRPQGLHHPLCTPTAQRQYLKRTSKSELRGTQLTAGAARAGGRRPRTANRGQGGAQCARPPQGQGNAAVAGVEKVGNSPTAHRAAQQSKHTARAARGLPCSAPPGPRRKGVRDGNAIPPAAPHAQRRAPRPSCVLRERAERGRQVV